MIKANYIIWFATHLSSVQIYRIKSYTVLNTELLRKSRFYVLYTTVQSRKTSKSEHLIT